MLRVCSRVQVTLVKVAAASEAARAALCAALPSSVGGGEQPNSSVDAVCDEGADGPLVQ